jgi:hypothetical protein
MKNSEFLKLNAADFIKGLILTLITALVTGLYELIQSGWALTFDWVTFKPIVMTAAAAALSYLIKNFFTNSTGEVLKLERK